MRAAAAITSATCYSRRRAGETSNVERRRRRRQEVDDDSVVPQLVETGDLTTMIAGQIGSSRLVPAQLTPPHCQLARSLTRSSTSRTANALALRSSPQHVDECVETFW